MRLHQEAVEMSVHSLIEESTFEQGTKVKRVEERETFTFTPFRFLSSTSLRFVWGGVSFVREHTK